MLMALPLNRFPAKAVCQTKGLYTVRHVAYEHVPWKKIMRAAINVKNFHVN